MPRSRLLWLLLLAGLVTILWRILTAPPAPLSETRLMMGTIVEIRIEEGGEGGEAAIARAFSEIARIEALMDPHRKGSDLDRLNASLERVSLSRDTIEVLKSALLVAERSSGAFSPLLGGVIGLWDFDHGGHLPDASLLAAALPPDVREGIALGDEGAQRLSDRARIDLGAIAKGYAVDRATEVLRAAGVTAGSVNAGGDIAFIGDKRGKPWRVAIQHPRKEGGILAVVPVRNRAVVTSGDYERYFEEGGKRYHHLLDPATGYPADRCQSVTVVAPEAMLADALATAAFVLGPESGLQLLEGWGEAEGILVAADGSVHLTSGLQGKVTWP